ncbi:MAG: bifunctional metallophosphatase/5'-nucleotidase [Bacteroidales bacterium]
MPNASKHLTLCLLFLLVIPVSLISQVKRFTLLNTTDEHSALLPLPLVDYNHVESNPSRGGYARVSTMVKEIRESKGDEPVMLFSSGDVMGGTPFAWLILEGFSPEIELMKETGFDAMTIGNHEFDYGPDILAEYFSRAGYPGYSEQLPLLASNLVIPGGHPLLETGLKDNHLFKLHNGITLGVFGLLGESAYSVASYAEPVGKSDLLSVAGKQIDELKRNGADIIIALTHAGVSEDRELAAKVEGIDIILGGHDHYTSYEPEVVNNTYIFHAGNYLRYLGMLEFEWDSGTDELLLANEKNSNPFMIPVDSSIEEDPYIREICLKYLDELNEFVTQHTGGEFTKVEEPIVYSDFELTRHAPMVETTVGNFVTDAMRLMGEEVTGEKVDLAFQGNGVIRSDIIPGTMEWSKGKISLFDLVTVSGLGSGADGKAGYPLVSFYITGKEIFNILEISSLLSQMMGDMYFLQVSGLRYSYDPGKAFWMRIPFAGTPVPAYRSVINADLYTGEGIQDDDSYVLLDSEDNRLYHVVTDYYLTSFLPMVGEVLPRLKLEIKDRQGNPVELDDAVIMSGQYEYKVWEAVAGYAASFEKNESHNLPVIPGYYRSSGTRIVEEEGVPLSIWSWTALILALILIGMLVRYTYKKIKSLRHRNSI